MNLRNWKISDAIFLATVPIVANIILLIYFWGYLSNFNIPVTLISFDLIDFFIVITILSIILSISLPILFFFSISYYAVVLAIIKKFFPQYTFITYRIQRSFIRWIFIAVSIDFLIDKKDLAIPQLIILGIVILIDFISPLFTEKEEQSYKLKLFSQDQKISDNSISSALIVAVRIWKSKLLLSILLVMLGGTLTFQIGELMATTQVKYPILKDSPEMTILYFGNDFLITAPFDRSEQTIDDRFQIINIADIKGVDIAYEEVGPLVLKSKKNQSVTNIPSPTTAPVFSPTQNSYP